MTNVYDSLIIGSGPCGIGAALKLKEKGLNIAIIEMSTPGGKINIAPRVDNYPRHAPIAGPDLAFEFYQRVLDNKIDLIGDEITSLTKEGEEFVLEGKLNTYRAKTVLVAAGTKERELGLPKERVIWTWCFILRIMRWSLL